METFFDEKYISREPIRFLYDVHSIGFVFKFSKQISITPILKYKLNNKSYQKCMNIVNTDVDGLHKIVYGPLFFNNSKETINPSNVRLSIILNNKSKKIIFKKKIDDVLDYRNFSTKMYYKNINLTFAVCSCFNLSKKNEPVQTDFKTLQLFNDTCKKNKPLMIISSGDIVYHIGPCNNFSSYGIQNSYDTLINLKESKSMWSNYTWVCVNDDHDISFNDGMKDSSNIKLLRKKLDENFPIGEQVMDPNKFRATYFNLKDVYFITLDTVTERTFNIDSQQNGNTYLTILGEDQLNYLRNVLCCIDQLTGSASLIFIVVGKSMFGSSGAFPDECIKEKEQIFEYIRKLKLKNIVFICGDSHFSDFTEYKDKDSGLIIREIRNSAITSEPKNPLTSDNPNRYSGSFSGGVNNFGFVDVNGVTGKYKVTYTNYTLNGEQFKYTWKMEK
jgi:alkaline phosphatase D